LGCATVVLLFRFVDIKLLNGELQINAQLPLHESLSLDAQMLIEALMSFLIPALNVILCVVIVLAERQKEASLKRIKLGQRLVLIPIAFMIASAVEETVYFTIYDTQFSMEYTWPAFVTAYLLFYLYAITAFKIVKSGRWLLGACSVLILIEVAKLVFPRLSFAYVVGTNIYISNFVSAVLFYAVFLFLAFSITHYQGENS
jgi:hypothetical protein